MADKNQKERKGCIPYTYSTGTAEHFSDGGEGGLTIDLKWGCRGSLVSLYFGKILRRACSMFTVSTYKGLVAWD